MIMEQWRKYLAEDVSEATAATFGDYKGGQRFVVTGPANVNTVIPQFAMGGSLQSRFRDEDDDEDVEDDEEAAEEDEDIELEEE